MSCYLCGHTNFTLRKGAVRDKPDLRVHECSGCGLVSLSSTDHIRQDHYENSGMHSDNMPPIETWFRDTEQDDQRRFASLEAMLANRRLLDFGCGAGGFLRKALQSASRVAGVEPENRIREFWRGRIDIFPDVDSVPDSDQYDVITAFHVVEHLPDPRTALRKLASHMEAGGRLVIEVPNAEDALLTLYDSEAFQHFTYWSQHLYLFSAETLRQLAVQAGLQVVAISQVQRYPLSNHLYWMSKGRPGGHQVWGFMNTPDLTHAYASSLAAMGRCDTLVGHFELLD